MVIICVLITVKSVIIGNIFILDCTINKKKINKKKIEIERAKRDQMVVHVVESSSCDIYRLVWITIITPPLHTFFTQKEKQKSDFFDGFVEESEKEYVNHHEASNTEMLVRLGRQLISSSSHCLCS